MTENQLLGAQGLLGLTRYASRVFSALARCHRGSAIELAEEAGVPRQRVYDVLSDLVSRGIVLKRPGRPVRYETIDPLDAANRLIAANRAALFCEEERLRSVAEELREEWVKARQEHPRVVSPGKAEPAAPDRWRSIATSSVIATSPTPLEDRDTDAWVASIQRLTSAGGTARCLYHAGVRHSPRHFAQARQFESVGEQARVTEEVTARWMVLDRRHGILPLPTSLPWSTWESFIMVEQTDVVARLEREFATLWARATPLSRHA